MEYPPLLQAVGGRKFVAVMAAQVINGLLVVFGFVGESVYSTVAIAVMGGYLTANVTQKAVAK